MRLRMYIMLALLVLSSSSALAEDQVFMRVSLVKGEVLVSGKDLPDWSDAAVNTPLTEGDRLWVPEDGRTELQLQGGFYVRLDEMSSLDVLSLEDGSIQLYLDQGHAYFNNIRGGIKVVQLDTPLTSVRSYDNSIMMLDVSEDGKTDVSVLKGYAYAETRAGAARVSAGNTLTITADGTAELSPIGPLDEWERWNQERDNELLAWGESARYLPDELHEYSSDLDTSGRWVYASDYGYVWTPVITGVDWAPYTVGRWVWLRGNYVWISYEPWGWVPYHYGRWVFVARFGWCWIPPVRGAVYWGPGWVGWVVTPTYLGWVPLAPGEVYYGYGYYGPGSVNIINVNINTIVVNRNYKNIHVKNSVTVIDRNDFEKGRWKPVKVKEDRENPFLERRPPKAEFVPPRVRPAKQFLLPEPAVPREVRPPREREERKERALKEERERRFPAPGPSPELKPPPEAREPERRRPPERVMKTRPEDVKVQRRFVKEKEASAFKPERPADLPVLQKKEPKVIIRKQPVPQQAPQPPQKPQKPQQQQKQRPQKQEEGKEKRDRN